MARWVSLNVMVLLLGSTLSGCGGDSKPPPNKAPGHLRKLILACELAIYETKRPPRNLEELKPYVQQVAGKEDADEILRSPNDGQPYEIIWGVNFMEGEADVSAILAYEKVGIEGKRYAINVARLVRELSESEFKEARFARGKP